MIQPRTMVNIADNTGAKLAQVFKVLGGSKKRYARIGDVVVIAVKVAEPRKTVKKKDVHHALVGRIFGPIPREIQEKGHSKIISLAPEVV